MKNSSESVEKFFGERASEWATTYSANAPRDVIVKNLMARQRFVLEMVEASLPRGARILDAGCGPGEMAAKLMERGYQVWGLDIAEPMIRYARERCDTDRFRVGTIERIPFADHTFDGVVCLGVLEYLDADQSALREIRRVLAPGGRAFLSTPSAICPLHRMDRMLLRLAAVAEPLSDLVRYRLRGRPIPARTPSPPISHRLYDRGTWLRLLHSEGLQPEEWLCYGWGWYATRLGLVVDRISRAEDRFMKLVERIFGTALPRGVESTLARSRAANWLCYEQLVRLRAAN